MKKLTALALALAFGALLAGCSTPASRIKKNPDVFAAFPEDVQVRVAEGKIEVGYLPDMVYIALGDPDRRYSRQTLSGDSEVWAYVDIYTTTERQRVEGPFRYRDVSGGYRTFQDTIWVNVEQQHEYEKLRVEFQNGIVVAIEELER